MTSAMLKKFYNHVLDSVPREKYEITTDMWGNNGWEVADVHENGADYYRVFLKRERQVPDNP